MTCQIPPAELCKLIEDKVCAAVTMSQCFKGMIAEHQLEVCRATGDKGGSLSYTHGRRNMLARSQLEMYRLPDNKGDSLCYSQ